MKVYVIASTEYEANMPDLFLMDAQGNYYGACKNGYVQFHNFPKDISFWMNTEGSDAGRYFNIDEVELPAEKVMEFDNITKKYYELLDNAPAEPSCPNLGDYKTKKDYNAAMDKHIARYAESDFKEFLNRREELWAQRTELFLSFSDKVTESISDNECIKHPRK